MKTQVMDVTPILAKKWLDKNDNNRKVRNSWVMQLAGMMERNEFKLTHQGIAISHLGQIIDGQHRLLAVIESGKTVPMMVTTDAPHELFNAIDAGSKRTFADMYKVTQFESSVSRLLAHISYGHGQHSVVQQAAIMHAIAPTMRSILNFCPAKKKFITTRDLLAAATISILAGADAEYVKLIYFNLCHAKVSEFPPVGRAYIDQMYAGVAKQKGSTYDAYCRALRVFEYESRAIRNLRVANVESFLIATRQLLLPILKKPKEKAVTIAPVLTRAKSAKTPQTHAA